MRIKYGDLPSASTCFKLTKVSFDTAKKNLAVFRFVSAVRGYQEYVENERNKLLENCANKVLGKPGFYELTDIFREKFNEVLNLEIAEELPALELTEDDFENCQYPEDKSFWMSASDIDYILNIIEKCKKERE